MNSKFRIMMTVSYLFLFFMVSCSFLAGAAMADGKWFQVGCYTLSTIFSIYGSRIWRASAEKLKWERVIWDLPI